jgi:single-stranded DNA-binding protein
MNDVTLVGNLTADLIHRVAEKCGRGVIHFDIPVNRSRYDEDCGQYVDLPPVQHRVLAYGPLADNAKDSLQEGFVVVAVG